MIAAWDTFSGVAQSARSTGIIRLAQAVRYDERRTWGDAKGAKMGICFRAAMGIAAVLLAPAAAEAACKVEKFADLPVTMDGLRPMVAARINGVDGAFIVDSGAFFSLLSPGMAGAAGLKLERAPEGFRLGGIGGSTSASIAKVKDLMVAGIPVHNIEFFVGGTDTGTAGLLGQNVLGIGDVEYDLPDGFVRLLRSHDCGGTVLAYWTNGGSYSQLRIEPRSVFQPHTIATVSINGTSFRAGFDTGAPTTMMSLEAAARLGLKPDSPGVTAAGFEGGLGRGVSRMWLAPVDAIRIGDEEIRNAHIHFGNLGGLGLDMLVGADFFISHRVYVDNSAHRMFFTYTGGEVFGRKARGDARAPMAVPAATQPAEPKDADGFSRRGAVFAAQHDPARALADYARAIALASKDPRYRVQRAEAYLADHRKAEALADLDQAIALDPANLPALLDRAELRIADKQFEGAVKDAEAAARAAAPTRDEHLQTAGIYESARAYGPAIEQFDLWIAAHREDARLPGALNGRCWARALANRELDTALDDCNAALRLNPHNPAFLDSRGLVRLRMGQWDKAIGDYDEVLKVAPKTAWSLYGRGIARRHKGLVAQGDADIAAAVAIAPELPEQARKEGIS
ncbi:MAG: hypothetical protein JWO81_2310 [Alphaproteobacteria bacterium]|nr:hypothetical protein [Alphaproteobacteria bacterium]